MAGPPSCLNYQVAARRLLAVRSPATPACGLSTTVVTPRFSRAGVHNPDITAGRGPGAPAPACAGPQLLDSSRTITGSGISDPTVSGTDGAVTGTRR